MTTLYEQDRENDKTTQGFRVYTRYFNFEISNPKGSASGEEGGFIDAMKAHKLFFWLSFKYCKSFKVFSVEFIIELSVNVAKLLSPNVLL